MAGRGTSLVLRVLLFAFGVIVLVLGLIFLMPTPPAGGPAGVFVAVDLLVLYALAFGPLLAGDLIGDLTAGRIVSMTIYFKALVPYALLTCVLVLCAATMSWIPLGVIVVLQLLGLFGLGIGTFAAMSVENQVEDVRVQEAGMRASLDRLRATSQKLNVQAAHLDAGEDTAELMAAINTIAEELRYLSPLHTAEAHAIEERIASYLDTLVAATAGGHMSPTVARQSLVDARQVIVLIEQRKTMRN